MSKSNKIQHNKKALLDALEKSLGIVTTACKLVGIDRTTFYRYVKEDEEFAKAVKDIDNIVFDFVESQLHKQIKEGNTSAAIFFAKTRMKNRGYIERHEVTGADGSGITLNINVENDKQKDILDNL